VPSRAEPLADRRFLQAEAPRYDDVTGELLWVDMRAGTFHVGRIDNRRLRIELTVQVGRIGCATPLAERSLGWVIAGAGELTWVRRDGSRSTILRDITPDTGKTLNDGIVAPDGSFWVGSQTAARTPDGALYRVAPDLSWTIARPNVTVSNGIDFSPDGGECYYIDTLPHRRLERLQVRAGEIISTATVTEVDGGNPDGLVLDADGAIWVAVWGAGEARRYAPHGELLETVHVPAERVSAVALVDRTLVITTAQKDSENSGGMIFAAPVGTPGKTLTAFAADEATLVTAARTTPTTKKEMRS
jgi:sugar lactone lactonase YvrE